MKSLDILLTLFYIFIRFTSVCGFILNNDPSDQLILTPYIEQGRIQEARTASLVGHIDGVDQVSYSGFFTVDKKFRSNMFFWFWPSQHNVSTDPVILWLEGGPGASSLMGLFKGNGPYIAHLNQTVSKREFTWNKNYSMLYIDNPVGAGFSYTKSPDGYSQNQTAVADNLYRCVSQFFQVFYELRQNPFYIAGSSYGGKFVTSLGYKIHQENNATDDKINLQGLIIGGGFCDPETLLPELADYLYNNGVLDGNQRDYFRSQTDLAVKYIRQKDFRVGYDVLEHLFLIASDCYLYNVSGYANHFSIVHPKRDQNENNYYYATISIDGSVLHTGTTAYNIGTYGSPLEYLKGDFLDTVKPWLAELMDNYKVLIYNGQYDMIVPVPATQAFLRTVPWSGLEAYKSATRQMFWINRADSASTLAGYIKKAQNLWQVIIQGAGHETAYDQPEKTFDMVYRFISKFK